MRRRPPPPPPGRAPRPDFIEPARPCRTDRAGKRPISPAPRDTGLRPAACAIAARRKNRSEPVRCRLGEGLHVRKLRILYLPRIFLPDLFTFTIYLSAALHGRMLACVRAAALALG